MSVKSSKGITLNTLIIYFIAMLLVIAFVGKITSEFYLKTRGIEQLTRDIAGLNVFNSYFTKEVKTAGNNINTIGNNYITFTTGNVFTFKENRVFYNTVEICRNVKKLEFQYLNNVIIVKINFNTFTNERTLQYKLEEIY